MRNEVMKRKIASKIRDVVKKELMSVCLSETRSIFRWNDLTTLQSFKWSDVSGDFQRTAPYLSHILKKCIVTKRLSAHPSNQDIVISIIAGILLRNQSRRANLIQRLFSVLLYSSNVPKRVNHYIKINAIQLMLLYITLYRFSQNFKKYISAYHITVLCPL